MTTKSVFVTLAGHTNAGKSSLLNAIIGEKIASVSPKPQTTRTRITGIKTIGETQMVFMDTPGLHKPTTKLSDHMRCCLCRTAPNHSPSRKRSCLARWSVPKRR